MFDDIFNNVDASRASKHLDALAKDERIFVDDFVDFLVREHNFKVASARSYKSNLARAIYKTRNSLAINSDERSAVRKFKLYVAALAKLDA